MYWLRKLLTVRSVRLARQLIGYRDQTCCVLQNRLSAFSHSQQTMGLSSRQLALAQLERPTLVTGFQNKGFLWSPIRMSTVDTPTDVSANICSVSAAPSRLNGMPCIRWG